MIREAEGYKQARIARAEGDASKFNAVLKEYRKAKTITQKRLHFCPVTGITVTVEMARFKIQFIQTEIQDSKIQSYKHSKIQRI